MALLSFRPADPFEGLLGLQKHLEQLLNNPDTGLGLGPSTGSVFPKLNIFRDGEGGVVAVAEVPGMDADRLELSVEPERLTIRGEREAEDRSSGSYHRRERGWGKFARSVRLPADLDPAQAAATARNGLLTVHIPRREEAKPRQISVSRS